MDRRSASAEPPQKGFIWFLRWDVMASQTLAGDTTDNSVDHTGFPQV
jgi:hypothetical protein